MRELAPTPLAATRIESTIGCNADECGNVGLGDADRAIVDHLDKVGLIGIKRVEAAERRRMWLKVDCHRRKARM